MLVAVQPQQARIVLVIHLHDEADHRAIVAVELGRELATNIIGPDGVLDRADIEDAGELAEMIGHDTAPHCKTGWAAVTSSLITTPPAGGRGAPARPPLTADRAARAV